MLIDPRDVPIIVLPVTHPDTPAMLDLQLRAQVEAKVMEAMQSKTS